MGLCYEHHLLIKFTPRGLLTDIVVRSGGCLEERAVRVYVVDVLKGLDYLHMSLIVHGDIKQSNVVVGVDGCAKFADYRCTRTTVDSVQESDGMPMFMALEVAHREEQGPVANMWALGCIVVSVIKKIRL
ncbi:mitogen-activated protein kinase kinase kinase 17-like [Phragmites australis]|uniref:mitogen-activated protein kinase kinase kinase 17-like n=1 Tax=Phragmites australis TaxID=29695 RepID=UPI002D79479C|nr:mitogen-activated protein kinase kinase kinase 17-like [Phragmites australis]